MFRVARLASLVIATSMALPLSAPLSAGARGQTQPTPATAASTPPAPASPTTAGSRLFEMRTYYANPGKIEDLHKRFRDHTIAIFKKHGMESVGYWVPSDKPDVLVYILAHKSKDAADASWKEFRDDPEWKKVAADSEVNGKLVAKIESVWLSATDYSAIR